MNEKTQLCKQILKDLIGFKVISGDSNLPLVKYITNYLEQYGIESHLTFDESEKKANVFATIGPQVDGGVILSGHTDVVPTTNQNWSFDPFIARENNERIYGRGSVDMKGFVALSLAQVPDLVKLNLARPIHLAFSYDEETGSFGAGVLADYIAALPYKPAYAFVGEPTKMQIIAGHKGGYEMTTTIKGVEGHSSIPERGLSAIHYACDFINFLLGFNQRLKTNQLKDSQFNPAHSSINVGTITGGTSRNTIAGQCQFQWEIRLMPNDDPKTILSEIRCYIDDDLLPQMKSIFPQADIDLDVSAFYPPLEYRPHSPIIDFAKSLTTNHDVSVVAFGTDASCFQQVGIETVVCGPGSIDQAHKPDEFIEISQLIEGQAFMEKLINWAKEDAVV